MEQKQKYMKTPEEIEDELYFGKPERTIDVVKYLSAIIAVNILVWGGIVSILWFIAKKVF
jgi:hypothetical protein